MKRDKFGGPQAEPDDDLTAIFTEEHGNNHGLEAEAESFEEAEWLGGWNCEVRNADGDSVAVIGHPARADLEAYLKRHGVEVV